LAAEKLLVKGSFPLPSVNQIISEAGVSKGTVYLYFKSKEEIYLSLLGTYLDNFEKDVIDSLKKSNKSNYVDSLILSYINFARENPKGVYLASIASLILENNLTDESIILFKKRIREITVNMLVEVEDIIKINDMEKLSSLFLVSYNLFLGCWQHCNPPEQVVKVLNNNNLEDILYDFEKEFSKAFRTLWASM